MFLFEPYCKVTKNIMCNFLYIIYSVYRCSGTKRRKQDQIFSLDVSALEVFQINFLHLIFKIFATPMQFYSIDYQNIFWIIVLHFLSDYSAFYYIRFKNRNDDEHNKTIYISNVH